MTKTFRPVAALLAVAVANLLWASTLVVPNLDVAAPVAAVALL
jgi:hypothetical protein